MLRSQIDLTFGGVVGGGAGGRELGRDAQRDLLHRDVLVRGVVVGDVGTAGGRESRTGLAVRKPSQGPSLLVRHEGREFGQGAGLAGGRRLAGHPAGV